MNLLSKALTDTKTAIGTVSTTVTTGAATSLSWIPEDIGKLATLLGIILTSILIISHTYKLYREQKESDLREQRQREAHEIDMKLKRQKLKALKDEED